MTIDFVKMELIDKEGKKKSIVKRKIEDKNKFDRFDKVKETKEFIDPQTGKIEKLYFIPVLYYKQEYKMFDFL